MKATRILTKEELAEWDELFSKMSFHAKNIDKILAKVKSEGSRHVDKWDLSDEVIEAQEILSNWMTGALKANKTESAKLVHKVRHVIDRAAAIYFKAYTYEVMSNYYYQKLQQKDSDLMKMSDKLEILKRENKNLKDNLEL